MKALRYHYNGVRLGITKVLGRVWPQAFVSAVAPTQLDEVPEAILPNGNWVRVRTQLAGICGSDVSQVRMRGAYDNPMTALISFPHVLGHEAVGIIEEIGPNVKEREVGERIVLNPWLSCVPRGIKPLCPACQKGDLSLCRNFDQGAMAPAIHLGNSADIAGVFAPQFVCHVSQCIPVPEDISDEAAVLADPFSVALHAILHNPPPDDAPALVYGQGTLGLMTVAVLRKLYPKVDVITIARFPHQVRQSNIMGVDHVLTGNPKALITHIASLCGAKVHHPRHGLPWLLDGVGIIYDMVGSAETLETSIRLIHTRGSIVVAGVDPPKRFEWTPTYFKEVRLIGSNAFGVETFQGQRRHAMEIYLDLATQGLDVSDLVTHHFPLRAWREAFMACLDQQRSAAIKVVFDFRRP